MVDREPPGSDHGSADIASGMGRAAQQLRVAIGIGGDLDEASRGLFCALDTASVRFAGGHGVRFAGGDEGAGEDDVAARAANPELSDVARMRGRLAARSDSDGSDDCLPLEADFAEVSGCVLEGDGDVVDSAEDDGTSWHCVDEVPPAEEDDDDDEDAGSRTSSVQLLAGLLSAQGVDLDDLSSLRVRRWAVDLGLDSDCDSDDLESLQSC